MRQREGWYEEEAIKVVEDVLKRGEADPASISMFDVAALSAAQALATLELANAVYALGMIVAAPGRQP